MRRNERIGRVGGEGSTEQHVKRLWSREGVRPLRVTKAGVAHEEVGRGKQVQPLRGLQFPWKTSLSEVHGNAW